MSHYAYLIHRAAKRPATADLELLLLDRDLAESGVHIPWTALVRADAATRRIVVQVVKDVLRAA